MVAIKDRPAIISHPRRPMVPILATITDIKDETPNTRTYGLQIDDPDLRQQFRFDSGQFNMIYLFGVGEAAISMSSDPAHRQHIAHTIRHCGSVTFGIGKLCVGDKLGLRGPFGNPWPVAQCAGRDVILVAGGIGLAPLRPVIYQILANRDSYGRVVLVYGSRSANDLLFRDELEAWNQGAQIETHVAVDYPIEGWHGPVGMVTDLIKRVRLRAEQTAVMVCGPRMMNRFVAFQLIRLRVPTDQIFVSFERNMRCGVGRCGHCQYGPKFVCKDGPVFSYEQVRNLFGKEEV